MKTKLTINPITVLISIIKFKLPILFLILNYTVAFAQGTCDAKLNVVKNRDTRSASTTSGTYFKMKITNKSQSNDAYILSSINNKLSCQNNDGSSNSNNVDLIISFMDLNMNEISKISLTGNETVEFYVYVTIPPGTLINKWCCTRVIAKSENCDTFNVTTDLHTLVISTSDE